MEKMENLKTIIEVTDQTCTQTEMVHLSPQRKQAIAEAQRKWELNILIFV